MARAPMASPLLDSCTTSAPYAAVAVGLKPVENPCTKRSSKKPATEVSTGYNKLQITQTSDPKTMTGTRPMVSVNFPLKGREIPAIRVNNAIISPLYSAPPILVK